MLFGQHILARQAFVGRVLTIQDRAAYPVMHDIRQQHGFRSFCRTVLRSRLLV
jgi:hypothetical protein